MELLVIVAMMIGLLYTLFCIQDFIECEGSAAILAGHVLMMVFQAYVLIAYTQAVLP